jgi:hypothetical protein
VQKAKKEKKSIDVAAGVKKYGVQCGNHAKKREGLSANISFAALRAKLRFCIFFLITTLAI